VIRNAKEREARKEKVLSSPRRPRFTDLGFFGTRTLGKRRCPEWLDTSRLQVLCTPLHRVLFNFRSLYFFAIGLMSRYSDLGGVHLPSSSICANKQIYS